MFEIKLILIIAIIFLTIAILGTQEAKLLHSLGMLPKQQKENYEKHRILVEKINLCHFMNQGKE